MEKTTVGRVVAVQKQWWLKVNTKTMRTHPLDGALFPHIIKVEYTVGNVGYTKRKWIGAGGLVPAVGSMVTVVYREENPKKATLR